MATFIDLSSDTATRPSEGMRQFMLRAPLGDEQKLEDPSVNALQERVAALLGKDQAWYLPSATMANEIAIKVHTKPGDEIVIDRTAHIVNAEAGGPALLSGVMIYTVNGERGMFTAQDVDAAIRKDDPHCQPTRLVSVEQTSNGGGGSVWPLARLHEVADAARRHNLRAHIDGSRLMNAVVASGVPAREQAKGYDSVTFCLTKGLGCPVGALVAGDREFAKEARRYKHLFGGAMRQAGIIAAAGLYALDHNVDRLAEDHANAKILARGLAEIPGIRIDVDHVETNLVFFDVTGLGMTAPDVAKRLAEAGVRMGAASKTRIRAVTHLDVSRADVERAVSIAQATLGKVKAGAAGD
ncbi:MAG TPA: GntG family PLP-dependent aldolase [bacterium]|nr:GntG family PLP-dependent aldolase [bacterium]